MVIVLICTTAAQNMSNYAVLFVGIIFANMLLMFGLMLPSVLDHYQVEMENGMLSKYQYMLQMPASMAGGDSKLEQMVSMMMFSQAVETENPDAEKFSAYSLSTLPGKYKSEEIILYGVENNSKYINIKWKTSDSASDTDVKNVENIPEVYLSSGYAEKFSLKKGDTITLKEKYENKKYKFKVAGVYDYVGSLSIFMPIQELNKTFDMDKDSFSGYFSDSEITDIDEKYIGSTIDVEDLTKISRQLDVSMGSMMNLMDGFSVIIFLVLIYLLSKIIIEKNAQSISMAKILGYTNGEISRLYIMSTSIVVVLFILISLPLELEIMQILFREMMLTSITGWITFFNASSIGSLFYIFQRFIHWNFSDPSIFNCCHNGICRHADYKHFHENLRIYVKCDPTGNACQHHFPEQNLHDFQLQWMKR